jgi:hypothetical protein
MEPFLRAGPVSTEPSGWDSIINQLLQDDGVEYAKAFKNTECASQLHLI